MDSQIEKPKDSGRARTADRIEIGTTLGDYTCSERKVYATRTVWIWKCKCGSKITSGATPLRDRLERLGELRCQGCTAKAGHSIAKCGFCGRGPSGFRSDFRSGTKICMACSKAKERYGICPICSVPHSKNGSCKKPFTDDGKGSR